MSPSFVKGLAPNDLIHATHRSPTLQTILLGKARCCWLADMSNMSFLVSEIIQSNPKPIVLAKAASRFS